jgi:hypothetical protein
MTNTEIFNTLKDLELETKSTIEKEIKIGNN